MLNRWYRKNERNGNPNYINFTYRNPNNFPLIRQIHVEYVKQAKAFRISIFSPDMRAREKILECYKAILTIDEFENNIYCFEEIEISINSQRIAIGADLLIKMVKVFEQINKMYLQSISSEIIKELKNLFSHPFNKTFVSEISTWQDIPSYVNPLRESGNNLARITEDYRMFPKKMNPTSYLQWLKKGENPNQKDCIGRTVLFMLTEEYSSFKREGVEAHAYKLIQILIFYGANIFYAENGVQCVSPAEILDQQGFPDVFRGIIMANSRVEKPLNIKSVNQSILNDVITTEFEFQDKKEDPIVAKLLPVDKFNQDQTLIKKSYELFSQTFEASDGSIDKVKKEFEHAFTSDKNEKILVDAIYKKNMMIGFIIFKISINSKGAVLNIEYALVDKKYRFGLMTFLAFRIAFCLSLLNPDFQSGVFFGAVHLNSWEMICREFVSPKYDVLGAERVIEEMLEDSSDIKIVKHDITWTREEALRVIGGYFTKPTENIQQEMFYKLIMGFKQLVQPDYPIAALIYAPVTDEWFRRMQESAKLHGFDFYQDLINPLTGYLSGLFGRSQYIASPSPVFPKALSLFAPPKESRNSVESPRQMTQIKAKL